MKKLKELKVRYFEKKKNELREIKFDPEYIRDAVKTEIDDLYDKLDSGFLGLDGEAVELSRIRSGKNIVTKGSGDTIFKKLFNAFINPFTVVLIVLAIVSFVTDVVLSPVGEKNYATIIIIAVMVLISGVLKAVQETKSGNAAEQLANMIRTTTRVRRLGRTDEEILLEDVVIGDIIVLSAGDIVPADLRIINARDLFISQASLTGESEPVEKLSKTITEDLSDTEYNNIAFMGSTVISGSAAGIVIAIGDKTLMGSISHVVQEKAPMTNFEKGINSVSWVLIKFMLVMVPIVFIINTLTKGDWIHALLFAISIAVGLTPEMLPMIVTVNLAKGALRMSKEKVIIKNLNSIQNIGSMDTLCTDKTGTLTKDKVVLELHLDIYGKEDLKVLKHGFLNSYFQTGLKNLIDIAIIDHSLTNFGDTPEIRRLRNEYFKVDEIPFDFERRRMSVIVADKTGKTQMITKGAVEEMLSISSFVEHHGEVYEINSEILGTIRKKVVELNKQGMRVIAVAQKNELPSIDSLSKEDEKDMVLIGYLAFLDPPKESTVEALTMLKNSGVDVKVLTGDNEKVTQAISKKVGLRTDRLLLGEEVEKLTEVELSDIVEDTVIFAKLSPLQKSRIVKSLQNKGHTVGFMGDGVNDAPALKTSDVGISVDTAVDIAKESADVILLEKDLTVLEKGIIEGRKTYANIIKYIKMTASSNFGNMFSVLAASAFLPFLPMESLHLILLNLIYDMSCIAVPWDNVDAEFIKKPTVWEADGIKSFMLWMGPVSSIFDIATYVIMYFVICPSVTGGLTYTHLSNPALKVLYISLFQSGWFIESMWSQSLVIHMIRTAKIPFIQSRASKPVIIATTMGILTLTLIPFTFIGKDIGLTALPLQYFIYLTLIIAVYMALAYFQKLGYIKRYGKLL